MSNKRVSVIDVTYKEAENFFLKPESYITIDLPVYFDFSNVLKQVTKKFKNENTTILNLCNKKKLINTDVNYTMLLNKDGLYDWRPIKIVNPFCYVDLVKLLTNEENWNEIIKRFIDFRSDENIICISLPVISKSEENDKAETILNWWENLEQASIKYALNYKYCVKTDVTNCYGSIYTHSIAWAIMGKEKAKVNRTDDYLGNKIDHCIQRMQCGQTNGIPQGGTVFDFIAEIVLGYSDLQLSHKLNHEKISDFKIIRYRDDYRIFTNSKDLANQIMRYLSDILADLNMHFNSKKTMITTDIVGTAVKPDKLFWTKQRSLIQFKKGKKKIYNLSIQKHLWQVYELAKKYPNSGSVKVALQEFTYRISKDDSFTNEQLDKNFFALIGILVSIIEISPNSIPQEVSAISIILDKCKGEIKVGDVIKQILKKLKDIPNTSYINVWLQRLSITDSICNEESEHIDKDLLCQSVKKNTSIWNFKWLNDEEFKCDSIINAKKLHGLSSSVIPYDEIKVFNDNY